jgi:uncharacterized coiled-coil protein SlyX
MTGFYKKNAEHDGKFSTLELQVAHCLQEISKLNQHVSSQGSEISKLIAKSSQIDSLIQKTSKIDELIQEKEAKANQKGIFDFLKRTKPADNKDMKAHMRALLQQMKDLNTDHQH